MTTTTSVIPADVMEHDDGTTPVVHRSLVLRTGTIGPATRASIGAHDETTT